MQVGRPLFSQVMDFVPWTSFDRLVEKYGGDKNATRLRCAAQFRAMAFAQMTFRESLRDIEASLNAHPSKLYGMGFRHPVAKWFLPPHRYEGPAQLLADLDERVIAPANAAVERLRT